MKGGKYAKTLAKIQVRGVFPIRDSLRSMAVLSSRAHERPSRGPRNLRAKHTRTSGEAARKIKLLPPQSPRGFSALARLYYLARPTKTAILRRLYTRYPKKCLPKFIEICIYGDAMLVLIRLSTNAADGNQQKHLLPSFATKV